MRTVTVNAVEPTLANGVYNYKFATAETRHIFMAAGEDWLLHNQYAGVPLFANSGFNLYSSRMQLLSEAYLPVLGFGVDYSAMSADDSKVVMDDGNPGNAGEYTYRTTMSGDPAQWNQWLSDDSNTSDLMGYYYGNLFTYQFNEDKTGYVLLPSMAAADPVAVDSRTLSSGKEVSKTWQIQIKDGLEWKFNDTTDTSMITDFDITAVDFYETYKIALTEQWFRAISGGGDFVTGPQAIVNAQNFIDGTVEWEEVGIKLIDDNTLEFHFVDEQSQWNVKYGFADTSMTPIHTELYAALGEDFATDENTIAYHGTYYVNYYESGKVIRYTKNELHPDADQFFYTHRTFSIIKDSEIRFQEFLDGKLDVAGLPGTEYDNYKTHPGLKRIPGTTTFRLMINGTGTKEGQIAQFSESEWIPEPILANQDFKMALFHAVDRKKLAEDVLKTSQTQMYLFTDAYVVEAETGMPYRATPQGMGVGADLSPSTFGYNLDAATAYYELALDALVEDGTYADGDEIKIEFYYFSGSETQELMGAYLKTAFEEAFVSANHDITFVFEILPKDFPGIYYDHMMIGEFDTSIGGISGSRLDAASFLDTYSTDNRSGFTLNWGIDSSKAEIPVSYMNDNGEYVKELWSFDAISSVLVGEIEVLDGEEVMEEEEATEE
jgi:ABC-type oligopeptide transport system substrate-binding subunit